VVASKGTELFSDFTLTVTPSRGENVSSKTLPLKVVFSITEISLVAAGRGVEVALGAAVGATLGAVVGATLGAVVGAAVGSTEALGAVVGATLGAVVGATLGATLPLGLALGVVGAFVAGPQATSMEMLAAAAKLLFRIFFCMSVKNLLKVYNLFFCVFGPHK
jgi:hypothetical protein